jgi:hypothetical protein
VAIHFLMCAPPFWRQLSRMVCSNVPDRHKQVKGFQIALNRPINDAFVSRFSALSLDLLVRDTSSSSSLTENEIRELDI